MRIYELRKELAYLDDLIATLKELGFEVAEELNGPSGEYYEIRLTKGGRAVAWYDTVAEFIIEAQFILANKVQVEK